MQSNSINAQVHLKNIPEKDLNLMKKFLKDYGTLCELKEVELYKLVAQMTPHAEYIFNNRDEWMKTIKETYINDLKKRETIFNRIKNIFVSNDSVNEKYDDAFNRWVATRWDDDALRYHRMSVFGQTGEVELELSNGIFVKISRFYLPFEKTDHDVSSSDKISSIFKQMKILEDETNDLECLHSTITKILEIVGKDHIVGAEISLKEYNGIINKINEINEKENDNANTED